MEHEMVLRARHFGVRVVRRLKAYGLMSHVLGTILRGRFSSAGIVLVMGWPPPEVDNRGGRIEVGNCGFFGGVRLECWRGAEIRIGNGTYLNRGVEIVAASSRRRTTTRDER